MINNPIHIYTYRSNSRHIGFSFELDQTLMLDFLKGHIFEEVVVSRCRSYAVNITLRCSIFSIMLEKQFLKQAAENRVKWTASHF